MVLLEGKSAAAELNDIGIFTTTGAEGLQLINTFMGLSEVCLCWILEVLLDSF